MLSIKKENSQSEFHNKAKDIWMRYSSSLPAEAFEAIQIELYKEIFRYFLPEKVYYFVFNVKEAKFDYLSPDIKDVLGFDNTIDTRYYLERIHPDDRPYFLRYEKQYRDFVKTLPVEDFTKYKLSYDFRVMNKKGKYIRILHQVSILQYTNEKEIYRTLCVHSDISHLKKTGTPEIAFIGMNGARSIYQEEICPEYKPPVKQPLTRKEQAIFDLIRQGKKSKEMAGMLNVSVYTINNHRKNILKKQQCRSLQQLLAGA